MSKKKRNDQAEIASEAQSDLSVETPSEDANDNLSNSIEREATPKKEWAKRPDPFGIESIYWGDGYKVSLKESDTNRECFIQFGNGSKSDIPQNFEAIRDLLKKEYGMYWDVAVQGWAAELKPGITPLIKEQNRRVRESVQEAFYRVVVLEEAVRGSSLSELGKEQGMNR